MLQWFEFTKVGMGENVKKHFSRNLDICFNKNDLPQCLDVFFIVLSLFSANRSLLSELSLSEFPLLMHQSFETPAPPPPASIRALAGDWEGFHLRYTPY